jgi:hypothetical protein
MTLKTLTTTGVLGQMKTEQVDDLEQCFATFTPSGWRVTDPAICALLEQLRADIAAQPYYVVKR